MFSFVYKQCDCLPAVQLTVTLLQLYTCCTTFNHVTLFKNWTTKHTAVNNGNIKFSVKKKKKKKKIFIQKYLQSSYFFGRRVVSAQTAIISTKSVPQKWELYILCLDGGLVSPKRARITGCAAPWWIFSSNKVCQPTGRKGSIQAVCRKMLKKLDRFLYEAAKNVNLFFKIQDQN
jgi:hypothetical protein